MAKFGYMLVADGYDTEEQDYKWMNDFGCIQVVKERIPVTSKARSLWESLLEKLRSGDVLVIPKLSNVLRGSRNLMLFLEYCRINDIRLVSIHDKIDSKDELFPNTRTSDVLSIIALLPKEANAFRKAKIHARKIKKHIDSLSSNAIRRADRNKNVVNMYLQGFSIDDIYEKSGFRSRSSVFRILNEANVDLNRGRSKGQLGPRKKKADQPKEGE